MKKIVSLCLMLAMSMMMWADQALFLVPNSSWLQADAKFAVYYFGGDNTPANGWSDIMFAQPDETNVYMTYIPEGYTNVIFVRLNSTATAGSFDEGVRWNQTADIALPVDGRDMMTLEDGWDNISGTWSIHGLVPEPQDTTAVEVNYYIKNNWNNAAWTWLQMESNANGSFYSAMGVFGGSGVNINTAMSDEGAVWYPVDSMVVIGEQVPAALDTVVFHYYPAIPRLTAQVMGSHAVEPQPARNYYIKNNWNGGEWAWQPMAWTADSLACTYTGVFGGTGVNINTEQSDNGSMWFTVADMAIGIGGHVPQAGDTVLFTFTIGMHTLAAEVLGRSGVEPQPVADTIVITAVNTFNWNTMYAYTWTSQGAEKAAWPGEVMTKEDAQFRNMDVYTYIMTADYSGIIFNDGTGGDGHQTADLVVNAATPCYYNGVWYASLDVIPEDTVTPQPVADTIVITAVNTFNWNTMYAYTWTSQGAEKAAWPGEVMTKELAQFRNMDVYTYTMTADYSGIIFNDGTGGDGHQTADLVVNAAAPCYYNGAWYASLDVIPEDTVAPQPHPENYYIKNNWNGGDWAWRQMEVVGGMSDDTIVTFWGYTDVFGGVGVNISTTNSDDAPMDWYAINDFIIADGDLVPQAMDSVSFIYDAVNHLVYAFVINRPGVDPLNPDTIVPQPVEDHYYLVGAFNNWTATEAIEFANADSLYTLSLDSLAGEFKVIDARDWEHGIYGFYTNDYQMPLGSEYNLKAGNSSENIVLDGSYTNVVLNLTKANDVLTLHFVAGTLVEDTTVQPVDTTVVAEAHYYLVGAFNDWDVDNAPEFVNADSLYALSLAALAGEFKIVGAHDWVHGNYGFYTEGYQLALGGEYNLLNGNDSKNMQLDGSYTNVVLTLTEADDVLTLHFVSGTLVEDTTIIPEPEAHYYLIGNYNEWNTETTQEFVNQDSIYTITIDTLFGEFKVMTTHNWSDLSYGRGDNDGVLTMGVAYTMVAWSSDNMSIVGTYTDAVLNLEVVDNVATLTFVSGTLVEDTTIIPEPEAHYYLIGNYNDWDVATTQEFEKQGDIYTITIDTLFGEFKVMTAHDWSLLSYGRGDNDGVLTMGVAYTMVAWSSDNMSIVGTYTNAVLNLEVVDNVATLTFVSGTPVVEPQPEMHYYLIGSYNDWDVATTQEFEKQGDIYTITIDTLFGEFKVMTAHDWSLLSYGRGDDDGVLTMGVAYTMVEWAPDNMSIEGTYTNAVLNLEVNGQVATLTFVSGTPVGGPQPVEEYFIKNNWDGADAWTWEQMIPANDGLTYGYIGVFGGSGVNVNTVAEDEGATWYAIADFSYEVVGYEAQAGDTIQFVYAPAEGTMTAILIGRPDKEDALEDVTVERDHSYKMIEKGVLYIYRNGRKYNVQGQNVR